jgi:hypothetical protein
VEYRILCVLVRAADGSSRDLTVVARGYYEAAGQQPDAAIRQAALEGFNEIHHGLSAHFRRLLGDAKAGFPDEAIRDVLLD